MPARSAFLSRQSAFFRLAALRAGTGAAIVLGGGSEREGWASLLWEPRLWSDEPIACGAIRVQGWGG